MITGAQIRMARGFLRWSAKELADHAGVAESTIKRMEQEEGFPIARGANIEAVYKTLMGAGIVFLAEDDGGEGPGIRIRKGFASAAAAPASATKRPARTAAAPRKSSRPKRR